MPDLSIVVPSRNSPFATKTIQDILEKAVTEVQIIVNVDENWPNPLMENKKITYIHPGSPRGMRWGINAAVALAKGKYLMKTDDHCMFAPGFDKILIENHLNDDWVQIPRRYSLDPEKWKFIDNPKYPIDYMYLSKDLHGVVWNEKNKDPKLKEKLVDETMSNQGSVWFMTKNYFRKLELMDEETYGTFWNEFQEIGLKCWLSGGKIMVNKKTWYAHWHKTNDVGRGYSLSESDKQKALTAVEKWKRKGWHKQTLPLSWLIERFKPVPTWTI